MPRDHRLRRRMKEARPSVVAEPLPRSEDLILRRSRQRRGRRKTRDERLELLDDPRDLRLLEHQFAHEGAIPVAGPAPRKVARGAPEPRFQEFRHVGITRPRACAARLSLNASGYRRFSALFRHHAGQSRPSETYFNLAEHPRSQPCEVCPRRVAYGTSRDTLPPTGVAHGHEVVLHPRRNREAPWLER